MTDFDLVLLTADSFYEPSEITPYIHNALTEDLLVQEALERKGLRCIRKSWSDPNFQWSTADFALFRTTWDYSHRFEEFSNWLQEREKELTFINPLKQIRWNMDKHYLLDLAEKGINIPASHFIKKGTAASLKELHQMLNWEETVLKPTVSAGGRHTYRLNTSILDEYESLFAALIEQEDFILQKFQPHIITHGEASFIVIGGKYSHAVLKKAKAGDFRVQDGFGGTVHEYFANDQEIAFAESVVQACTPLPIYARVDVIWDESEQLAVSEIELFEPELWFRNYPLSANELAETIHQNFFT